MDLNEISIWADIFKEIVQDTKDIYNTNELTMIISISTESYRDDKI